MLPGRTGAEALQCQAVLISHHAGESVVVAHHVCLTRDLQIFAKIPFPMCMYACHWSGSVSKVAGCFVTRTMLSVEQTLEVER